MAEKMPSSVKLGARPISCRMRSYSSGLRPCAAMSAAPMRGSRPRLLRAAAGGLLFAVFFFAAALAALLRDALWRFLPVLAGRLDVAAMRVVRPEQGAPSILRTSRVRR